MSKKEQIDINVLMSLIPDDSTVEGMWTEGNSMTIRSYHLFPENFIVQAKRVAQDHGCTFHTWENINDEQLIRISLPESTSREEEIYKNKIDTDDQPTFVIDVNKELKRYLAKHPQKLYDLTPRRFEELVADILKDFGFDVSLTPSTRDGGKDILAYMRNQICSCLMFVECKKWKPEQHVGIEIVQRLYGVQQANNANKSMVITTSFFSKPAIEESKRYEYMMDLKNYDDLTSWLKRYA